MAADDNGHTDHKIWNSSDFIRVSPRYDLVFRALSSSSGISTHRDFYHWLQSDIRPFLSHQTLLAVWGDFAKRKLSYDMTSSLTGVNTRLLNVLGGMDLLMERLFTQVNQSGRGWLVFEDFHSIVAECGIDVSSRHYRQATANVNAILAYTMHDERESHDCLYIFSLANKVVDINPVVLDLLMPHVDSALRRIKCLPPGNPGENVQGAECGEPLSEREREVLLWVSQGKSNEEVGTILSISHNTVKNHLKRIFNKMGVSARSQAVRVYMQGGGLK